MSYAKLRGDFSLATTQRFTASADVSDGDLVVENDRVGIAFDDTANGAEGIMIVATDGKGILMPKTTGAISRKMHLHARRLIISEPASQAAKGTAGGKLDVTAALPEHFAASMEALGFEESQSDASPLRDETPERTPAQK